MYSLGLLIVVNFNDDEIKFHKQEQDYTKIILCGIYRTTKPGQSPVLII